MSYEKLDTDSVVDNLSTIVNDNLGNIQATTPASGNQIQLMSQGNKGDSFGQTTGLKSDTPIVANITNLDEDGIPTLAFDRISLGSSLTIVDYIIPIVNVDLKYINFKPAAGTHVKFTPKVGRTLVLKSGGDFDIASDITIDDGDYLECVFYDATETGIAGGGFKPHKLGTTGVGGEFFGPMTADHNYGGFNIFNSTGVFFDAGLLTGILFNAGGVGLVAPTGDTIDVFINSLITPIFGFTETSLETNVPLNFANAGNKIINGLDVINFDEADQSIRSLSGGIRHDVPSGEKHYFRANTDEKFRVDVFGSTFEDNIAVEDSILSLTSSIDTDVLQLFMNPLDTNEAIINATNTLMIQRGSVDTMEINSLGVFLPNSKNITMDDLFTADVLQITQVLGDAIFNYTGTMKITESGADVLTLGGLIIQANKDIDMLNNQIDNIYTAEIEENFTAGGVPPRPVNGAKLFVRQQFGDAAKNELRAYFQTGNSQLIASEP